MNRIASSKPRKKLLIGGAVSVLVLASLYSLISLNHWSQIKSTTATSHQVLRTEGKKLFADSTSSSQRSATITKLARMEPVETCTPGWWADWQSKIISSVNETKKACLALKTKQTSVQKAAKHTQDFLQDQKKIQSALAQLALGKTAITENSFTKHAKTVTNVVEVLKKTSVHRESSLVLEKAKGKVKTISEAWASLLRADKAKNRERYEESVDTLDQAYLGLKDVSDEAQTVYATLLQDLETELR